MRNQERETEQVQEGSTWKWQSQEMDRYTAKSKSKNMSKPSKPMLNTKTSTRIPVGTQNPDQLTKWQAKTLKLEPRGTPIDGQESH